VDEQEHDLAKKVEAVAKADEVLKPLLLACDSNTPKMVAIGVGSIQKLIAQNAVSEVHTRPHAQHTRPHAHTSASAFGV
jgi:hypothetical protein